MNEKQIKDLTCEDIQAMSYNELIGLVKETNRPPGGLRSIVAVAKNAFITKYTRVLEIGTSTGITAIELARLTGAEVYGIDINKQSLEEARNRARRYGVEGNTQFYLEDATDLSFEDGSFDVVFCGNVTSLISEREKVLSEYSRVLRIGGILSAIPMYYVKEPSSKLVEDVSQAIQVNIVPHRKDYWVDFFTVDSFHPYIIEDFAFDQVSQETVDDFAKEILSREHLRVLEKKVKKVLETKYTDYMQLFRDNLSHMGYSIMLYRKEPETMDRELFTSSRVR